MRTTMLILFALLCLVSQGLSADHPDSGARCETCHAVGEGSRETPKVLAERPNFWERLLGKKRLGGHLSVSCAGSVGPDGTITGCHRPEDRRESFLVLDVLGQPVDELCGRCHSEQRVPGAHHPSYKSDKDGDRVPETIVRSAEGEEIFSEFAASRKAEPVKTYPDAILFQPLPDGSRRLEVAMPLETVVEVVGDREWTETQVVTCTTCHNPHYGYLVGVGTEEELNRELVARESGDALLRLRDYNNDLCNACH